MGFTNSASNITQSNSLTSNSTLLSQAHEALEVLTISVHEALIPPINWSERNTKVEKHIKALNNIFSAHLSNLKDFQRPSLVDKRYRADTPRNSRKDFKLPAAEELKLRMFREATITISSALKALAKQVAATKGDYRSRARGKGLSEFLALEEKKLGYFYLFELNTLHFKIASIEGIKKLAASPNEYLENFPQYHNLNLFQMNYEFIEAFDYIHSYFPSNNLIHTYNSDFIEPLDPSGVRPLLSGVPLFNSLPIMYRQVYYDQLKGAFFVINRALSVASPSGSTYPSFYWVDINKILFPLEPEKFAPIIEDPPEAVYRKLWRGNSLIRIKAQKFLAWLADISEGELRKYFWYKDHTEILRIQREMQPIYREYINFIEQANREPAQTSTLTLSTTTEALASGPQNNSSSTYSYISNPVSTAPIFYLNQTEQNNITDNNAADSPTTLSAESVTNQLENQGSNLTAEEKTLTSSLYKEPPTTEASSTTSLTSIKTSEPETSEASFIFTESTQNFTAANVSNSTDTSSFASNTTNNNTSSITPDTSLLEEGKTSELEDSFYFDSAINRNDSILNGTSSPYLEFANTSIIIETTTEIAVSTSPITTETVTREEEKTPEIERSFTSADSSTGISYTEATTISTVRDITTIITEMLSSSNPISLTSTIPPLKFIEESILSRVIANIISKYTQAFFALDELKFATVLKESSFKASPNITYSFIKASIIEQVNLRAVNKYLNEGITLHNYIFKEELEQSNFRYIPIKVEEILLLTLQVLAKNQFRNLDYNKVKPVVEKYIQDVWSLHLYDTNILYEGYPEVSGNIAKEYKKHFTKLSLNEIQITRRFIEAIDYVSENSLRLDPLIETNREPWERYKPSIKKSRTQIYKEHFRKKAQNIFVNVIRSFSSHVNTASRGWVRKHLYFLRNQYTHSDLLPTPEDIMYRGMPDKEIITQRASLAKWLSTVTDVEFSSYFPESYREEALKEKTSLKPVFEEFVKQSEEFLGASIMIVFKEVRQSNTLSTSRNNSHALERNEQLLDELPNNNTNIDMGNRVGGVVQKSLIEATELPLKTADIVGQSAETIEGLSIEGEPSHKLIRRERREAPPSYSAENSFKVKSKKPINDNNIAIPNSASTHAGFINSFFSSLIGLAGYIVSTRVPEAQPLNNWPNIAAETSSSHEQETTAELNINSEFPDVTANLTLMAWVVGKVLDRKLSHFTAKGELTPDQRQGIKRIIHLYLLAAVKENCRTSGIGISYLNMMGIEKLSSRISSDILNGRQPNISNFSAKDLLINWRSKDPRNADN